MVPTRVFLDTNIVADLIDSSRKGYKVSVKLLEQLIENRYEICISEDMLTTLYYILEDKKRTLQFFKELIFIDWTVLTFGMEIIREATEIALEKQQDLEDIMQCLCARESGCAVLITNDKKFYDCGIGIVNTEEFLEMKL